MTGRFRVRLLQLSGDAWREHRRAEADGVRHLVRPSAPILYFGDSVRFHFSPLRVITVGLNPSREEFPRAAPFCRFQELRERPDGDHDTYLAALDAYFRGHPYTGWFNPSFEPLLRGLGVSYYDGQPSSALHTDLCSPLATDPTWSRLGQADQMALEPTGIRLWHELIETLQPDAVLISVARLLLDRIGFPASGPGSVIHPVDGSQRRRPYRIEGQRRRLASGKEPLFVFGPAAQQPFGLISARDKILAGMRIGETIR
jgi:hypothetical protein